MYQLILSVLIGLLFGILYSQFYYKRMTAIFLHTQAPRVRFFSLFWSFLINFCLLALLFFMAIGKLKVDAFGAGVAFLVSFLIMVLKRARTME